MLRNISPMLQMNETEFRKLLVEDARKLDWHVAHVSDSRKQIANGVIIGDQSIRGFPDLILARERVVFAELKREKGKLTDMQKQWLEWLKFADAEVYVWRPSAYDQILRVLL